MRKWLFWLVFLTAGVIQLSLGEYLKIFGVKPDFLLTGVLVISFSFQAYRGIILGIICGIFKDVFLAFPFGLNTILFTLWSYLINRLNRQVSTDSFLIKMGLILFFSLLQNLCTGLFSLHSGVIIPVGIFLKILFISLIYTGMISLLFFKLLDTEKAG